MEIYQITRMNAIRKHMTTNYFFILSIILTTILSTGCLEKEMPIEPHASGETKTNQVILGSDYGSQIHYNLSTNSVVNSNETIVWDVAFNVNENNISAILNSSRIVTLAHTNISEYNTPVTEEYISELEFIHDDIQGPNWGTAIGDIFGGSDVTIINLGVDINNEQLGLRRLQIDSINDQGYFITYGDIDLTYKASILIPRSNEIEWLHFSILNGTIHNLEPKIGEWDLYFTKYIELLDEAYYYPAVGVLSMPEGMEVCDAPELSWNQILVADWDTLEFSTAWNEIGYDWKEYDFESAEYSIDNERCFAIRTANGKEFVLRFLDFYDQMGNIGTITLESVER
jgi:hypothetical protein